MRDFKTVETFIMTLYLNFGTFFFLVALGKLPYPDAFVNDQPIWKPENTRGAADQWYLQPFKPSSVLMEILRQAGSGPVEGKQLPSDVGFKEFSVLLGALNKGKTLAKGRYVADIFNFLLNDARPPPDYRKSGMPFWHASTTADYIVMIGHLLGFRVDRDGVLARLVRVEYVAQLRMRWRCCVGVRAASICQGCELMCPFQRAAQ